MKVGDLEITEEQARKSGLLHEQRLARHRRNVARLEKSGLGNSTIAKATRAQMKPQGADTVNIDKHETDDSGVTVDLICGDCDRPIFYDYDVVAQA